MPRKTDIPSERGNHYEDTISEWISFIRNEKPAVRKNTELRITEIPFKDLYTSAISKALARFDVHFLDSGTTRDGDILEVKVGTTLYDAIAARYTEALSKSCPLWRLWWWRALRVWGAKVIVPVFLLGAGIALASSANPYLAAAAVIFLGLLVNWLYVRFRLETWFRQTLFRK